MQALVLTQIKKPLEWQKRAEPAPREGEVVVRLKAAALNRRDFWITQGLYPGIQTGVVLGSDGAGVVSVVGSKVASDWLEREVVINPGFEWGQHQAAQSDAFHILGMPRDGTFASEVVVPVSQLQPKPEHLNWLQAAALPLAGLTAYRALFVQGGLAPGDKVLITGIGGGVAVMALLLAVSAGAEVVVTSSAPGKIQRAVGLGAVAGYDYASKTWSQDLVKKHGRMSLMIDGAAGPGYGDLLDIAAPGGKVVNYGATAGPPEKLDMFKVFWKQLHLVGSTMGSPEDFAAMLNWVNDHQIKPVVDEVFPLSKGAEAVEKMKKSPQFGKYVLNCSDLA